MIPEFNEHGYLPAGIHFAALDEIGARFGHRPELRQIQMESLRWLVDIIKRSGAERLIVNGSFVTDQLEPNDIDCVALVGNSFPRDDLAAEELAVGLPFIDLQLLEQSEFDILVEDYFASDRAEIPKGVIEVLL